MSSLHVSFDKVAARVERLAGEEVNYFTRQWLDLATRAVHETREDREDLGDTFGISALVDLAVTAGYSLAKAESYRYAMTYAQRGLASTKGGAVGGRKSGSVRRTRAVDLWGAHALELAQATRQAKSDMGRADLAADVVNGWKLEGKVPGHPWVMKFLKEKEATGELICRLVRDKRRG